MTASARSNRTPTPTPPQTRSTIAAALHALAQRELGTPLPPPGTPLNEAFDSMALMTLVVAVEDHFEVCLEPEDECRIVTADDLVDVVLVRLGDADPPSPRAA